MTIKQTQLGLIPLQAESVDFVLINEVISQVNFVYLNTVFREIFRVLRLSGVVRIQSLFSPDEWQGPRRVSCFAESNRLLMYPESAPPNINS
ncbi:MAG: methyltransferase domain-containing protein, partial [Acidobacteriota bacterium]